MIKKPAVRAQIPTDRLIAPSTNNTFLNKTTNSVSSVKSLMANRPPLTSFENVINNLKNGTATVKRPMKRHASPEFRSKKPQTIAAKRLRRSRSVNDMTPITDIDAVLTMAQEHKRAAKQFRMPLAPAPKIQTIKPPLAPPKNKPTSNAITKPKAATQSAHKRVVLNKTVAAVTAKKENPGVKMNPTKAKIPAYDFKARFHDLSEKHKVLKDKHERLKEQLGEFESLPEQYDECRTKLSNLEIEYKSVQEQLAKLEQQNEDDQQKIKMLNDDLNAKIEECRNLTEAKNTITKQYNAVNTENIELKTNNAELETKLKSQQEIIEQLTLELQEAGEQLFRANVDRKDLHNTVMDLRGNIRVFCRVRPPLEGEENRAQCLWQHNDETSLEIGKIFF